MGDRIQYEESDIDQCCQSFFGSQNLIDHVKNFHENSEKLDNGSKVESKKKVICEEVVKDALARSKGKDTEYSQENHPSAVLDEENPDILFLSCDPYQNQERLKVGISYIACEY